VIPASGSQAMRKSPGKPCTGMSAAIGSSASQPTVALAGGPEREPATQGIARSIATTTSALARPGPVSSSGCRDGTLSRSRQSVSVIHAPAVSASSTSGATVRGSRPLAPVTKYGHSASASAAARAAIASGSGCAGVAIPARATTSTGLTGTCASTTSRGSVTSTGPAGGEAATCSARAITATGSSWSCSRHDHFT
jgi:hypothetical protein